MRTLTHSSPEYPDLLREISSPPKQLFVTGELSDRPAIAIVGSRRATDYGRAITYQLAIELARAGLTIVSGLALGIDSVAHQAAVEAGGHTVAVMAGGLDEVYPSSNRSLAKAIQSSGGALVSEYAPGTPPFKQNFVARNRIIAGLSLATVVTEAPATSGALITANFALEQNRLVLAVPGNITSPSSAGPNNLIRSGAQAITSASDILAALDLTVATSLPAPQAKSREEAAILDLLGQGVTSGEELIARSGFTASQFAQIVSLMEITGKVRNLGAGQWVTRK